MAPARRHACTEAGCAHTFASAKLLEDHLEAKHRGRGNRYPCKHCDKGFDDPSNRRRHEGSCGIAAPDKYLCPKCEAHTNKRADNLKRRHMDKCTGAISNADKPIRNPRWVEYEQQRRQLQLQQQQPEEEPEQLEQPNLPLFWQELNQLELKLQQEEPQEQQQEHLELHLQQQQQVSGVGCGPALPETIDNGLFCGEAGSPGPVYDPALEAADIATLFNLE